MKNRRALGLILSVLVIAYCSNCSADRYPVDSETLGAAVVQIKKEGYETSPYHDRSETSIYYQETGLFSQLYGNEQIEKHLLGEELREAWIWHVTAEKELLLFTNENTGKQPTVSVYTLETGEIRHLVTLEEGNEAACKAVNDRYLVWLESSSMYWTDGFLHISDFVTGEDRVFHTYTTDETHGMVFSQNPNRCVILDGTVYFDDIVGIDREKDILQINLYAYEISSGEISMVKKQAQHPLALEGQLLWFEMEDKTKSPLLVSQQEGVLQRISNLGMTTVSSTGRYLAYYDWLNTPEADSLFSMVGEEKAYDAKDFLTIGAMGIRLLQNGEFTYVLLTKKQIGQLEGDATCLVWDSAQTPQFYDIKRRQIIRMDDLPEGDHLSVLGDEHIGFCYYSDSGLTIYLIEKPK